MNNSRRSTTRHTASSNHPGVARTVALVLALFGLGGCGFPTVPLECALIVGAGLVGKVAFAASGMGKPAMQSVAASRAIDAGVRQLFSVGSAVDTHPAAGTQHAADDFSTSFTAMPHD